MIVAGIFWSGHRVWWIEGVIRWTVIGWLGIGHFVIRWLGVLSVSIFWIRLSRPSAPGFGASSTL